MENTLSDIPRTIEIPKYSKWMCHLFGSGKDGLCWRPVHGEEPNFFWRWMQFLCFGNRWTKDEEAKEEK